MLWCLAYRAALSVKLTVNMRCLCVCVWGGGPLMPSSELLDCLSLLYGWMKPKRWVLPEVCSKALQGLPTLAMRHGHSEPPSLGVRHCRLLGNQPGQPANPPPLPAHDVPHPWQGAEGAASASKLLIGFTYAQQRLEHMRDRLCFEAYYALR